MKVETPYEYSSGWLETMEFDSSEYVKKKESIDGEAAEFFISQFC